MSTDEFHQYCEWVKPTSTTYAREASIAQHDKHTAYASAGYIPKAIPDLITYLHAAAGYPVKQQWIRAIRQGNYVGWPGLTAERVQKYLSPKIETALGHMHKVKQGTKSTAPKQDRAHNLRIRAI